MVFILLNEPYLPEFGVRIEVRERTITAARFVIFETRILVYSAAPIGSYLIRRTYYT